MYKIYIMIGVLIAISAFSGFMVGEISGMEKENAAWKDVLDRREVSLDCRDKALDRGNVWLEKRITALEYEIRSIKKLNSSY
ncbi:MAG: hypothetical protein LBU76_06055 [Azoarcus sp.]|jgi:hypothetical protein|nr:hypothetical protein [Azoarcus sp.]